MSFTIDCGTCSRRDTPTCDDCMVTFIVDRRPEEAVVIDVAEYTALRRLQSAGMVPELLHDGATGSPHPSQGEPLRPSQGEPLRPYVEETG